MFIVQQVEALHSFKQIIPDEKSNLQSSTAKNKKYTTQKKETLTVKQCNTFINEIKT